MNIRKMQKVLDQKYPHRLRVRKERNTIFVEGSLERWTDVIEACRLCVVNDGTVHVVNRITCREQPEEKIRIPAVSDDTLEGARPDVLIIGGGVSGVSIARELSRYSLDILLIEKEADLAMHASGRNDGEIHCGIDLPKGSKKQSYVVRGNAMYDKVCEELDVPFRRCGQYVGIKKWRYLPLVLFFLWNRRYRCGIRDTRLIGRKTLKQKEPSIDDSYRYAVYNPSAGTTSPYNVTIAMGENAAANGVRICLNTAALSMKVRDGQIQGVETNRGWIHPKLVISAAGVFADDIAKMAEDQFFSIHPRMGTISILDNKVGSLVKHIVTHKNLGGTSKYTKGGAIVHAVSDNLLVGPDAVETPYKETFYTTKESLDAVYSRHQETVRALNQRDLITYFSGIRAATFEEDYIIEFGRETKNLIHVAGIQSPGLTTAPAVAEDVSAMVLQWMKERGVRVQNNRSFHPKRKAPPRLRRMTLEERKAYIQKNPDYGEIVCRCEEISKGEILDALRSPIPVPTIDGIKKRVRPGMGRCQGGFCMPLVAKIISEEMNIPIEEVKKSSLDSPITYGSRKGEQEAREGMQL